MQFFPRLALCLPLVALAACEDMTSSADPVAAANAAAQKRCIRAVEQHTKVKGGVINTTIPIVETNQHIVDLPNAKPWTCYTDDAGNPKELIETRL